jgi:aryl-alcohol dehydrogenase-like predicted oxidoreductase
MDLVLGTMYFGTRTDEATSFALLDRFVEAGGRTLDTANCYAFWLSETGAGGQSEAVLGRWLAANPGLRGDLVIATKVGVEPATPGVFDGPVEGLSGKAIRRAATRSIERLGTDVIDLYWAHGEDRSVDPEETVAAFGGLVSDGVVRRLGVSNHPTWRVEQARSLALSLGIEPYTALQLTTSYVYPRPGAVVPGKDHRFGFVTDETIDYVTTNPEIELWAYSPLVQGSFDRDDRPLPDAYAHRDTEARLSALTGVAGRHGVPRSQVVLAWLMAGTPTIRPIVGVSSLEQLDSAVASASLELSAEDLSALDTRLQEHSSG